MDQKDLFHEDYKIELVKSPVQEEIKDGLYRRNVVLRCNKMLFYFHETFYFGMPVPSQEPELSEKGKQQFYDLPKEFQELLVIQARIYMRGNRPIKDEDGSTPF